MHAPEGGKGGREREASEWKPKSLVVSRLLQRAATHKQSVEVVIVCTTRASVRYEKLDIKFVHATCARKGASN